MEGACMRLGTIKGIQIKIHYSTWIIVFLVAYNAGILYNLMAPRQPYWEYIIFGIFGGVMVLFSILSHELLHSITAKRRGLNVSEIEFFLFGGVSKITEEPRTPQEEIHVAIIGPILSLVLGGIFLGIAYLPISLPFAVQFFCLYSGQMNLVLGIFNLLPAFPMDGGRVLRALIWRKRHNLVSATQTAAKIGESFGVGMVIFGFIEIFFFGYLDGIWWILIGFFLRNSSSNSMLQTLYMERLSHMPINVIISEMPPLIPKTTPLIQAIQKYFLKTRRSIYPVEDNGQIIGVISTHQFQNLTFSPPADLIVGQFMVPLDKIPVISIRGSCKDALNRLEQIQDAPQLLVVKDPISEQILGFLEEADFRLAVVISPILKPDGTFQPENK